MSRRGSAGEIASTAAEATGNLAGVGLGALFAGAEGAVAGAVVGPSLALALKQAVAQVGSWITGRQEDRVSEAIRVAAVDLARHIAEGGTVREEFASGQSDAEDIAEGVLQTVAFAYEEKKAAFLGHLLAALAMRSDISVPDAHYMTRLVGRLTYRQLASLSVIGDGQINIDRIKASTAIENQYMTQGMADELEELSATYGLVGTQDVSEDEFSLHTGLNQTRRLPLDLKLSEQGRLLFDLLRLEMIPSQDQAEAFNELLGTTNGRNL